MCHFNQNRHGQFYATFGTFVYLVAYRNSCAISTKIRMVNHIPKVAENGPVPLLAQSVVCQKWLKTVLCRFWHNLLCAKSG